MRDGEQPHFSHLGGAAAVFPVFLYDLPCLLVDNRFMGSLKPCVDKKDTSKKRRNKIIQGSVHTNFLFGPLRFLLLKLWRILNVAVDYLLQDRFEGTVPVSPVIKCKKTLGKKCRIVAEVRKKARLPNRAGKSPERES